MHMCGASAVVAAVAADVADVLVRCARSWCCGCIVAVTAAAALALAMPGVTEADVATMEVMT